MIKKKHVFKVINKNGKIYFYKVYPCSLNIDIYFLENSFFIYKEENIPIELYNCLEYQMYNFQAYYPKSDCHEQLESASLFSLIHIDKTDKKMLLLRQPLSIFEYLDMLKDKSFLYQFIDTYPIFLYTFAKREYRRYISKYEIVPLLVEYQIYPTEVICHELFVYILSKDQPINVKEYAKNIVKKYIYDFDINRFGNLNDYNDKEKEDIKKIFSSIIVCLENNEFMNLLLERKYLCGLREEIEENCLVILSIADELELEYDNNLFYKLTRTCERLDFTEELKYYENTLDSEMKVREYLHELDKLFTSLSCDYKTILNVIRSCLKYASNSSIMKKEIFFNRMPDIYLNDKEFLLAAEKENMYLFLYSSKYKNDINFIYKSAKKDQDILKYIDFKLFDDPSFVLTIRHVCPRILFYVSSLILNDEHFMYEYIKIFPIDHNFRLGEVLSKNIKFIKQAYKYDANIIFYCDKSLYDCEEFMRYIIDKNYDLYYLSSIRLKKKQDFFQVPSIYRNVIPHW